MEPSLRKVSTTEIGIDLLQSRNQRIGYMLANCKKQREDMKCRHIKYYIRQGSVKRFPYESRESTTEKIATQIEEDVSLIIQ